MAREQETRANERAAQSKGLANIEQGLASWQWDRDNFRLCACKVVFSCISLVQLFCRSNRPDRKQMRRTPDLHLSPQSWGQLPSLHRHLYYFASLGSLCFVSDWYFMIRFAFTTDCYLMLHFAMVFVHRSNLLSVSPGLCQGEEETTRTGCPSTGIYHVRMCMVRPKVLFHGRVCQLHPPA